MTTKQVWTGRVFSGIAVAFMIFDGAIKFSGIKAVADSLAQLGLPADIAPTLGVIGLACTLLYAIPRTAVFGAVLLTGYLGGAIAINLRVGLPLFSHILFPIYLSLFIWGGLWFRDERVRALIPMRATA